MIKKTKKIPRPTPKATPKATPKSSAKRPRPIRKPAAARNPRTAQRITDERLTERLPATQTTLFDLPVAPVQPAPVVMPEARQPAPAPTPATPAPIAAGPAAPQAPAVSNEELYKRIQFNAYLLAEKDGFKADPVHYWIQAERAAKAEVRQSAGKN